MAYLLHPSLDKKSRDYNSQTIIKGYEIMQDFYPKDRVVFGVLSTYSRYAEREKLFYCDLQKELWMQSLYCW